MDIYRKIFIVGEGGSGKDFLVDKYLSKKPFKKAIFHTTRPRRTNEVNGVDYHFVDKDFFIKNSTEFLFFESFRNDEWFYGVTISEFVFSNVIIVTPKIIKDFRNNGKILNGKIIVTILYVHFSENIRLKRLTVRNDKDSCQRRLEEDGRDFKDFKDFTFKIIDTVNQMPIFVERWISNKI